MQTPTVGRIVHYVSHGSPVQPDGSQRYPSVCRAAIVTAVQQPRPQDGSVPSAALAVLNPTGMFFDTDVPFADPAGGQLTGGTWHWPERA